MKNIDVDVDYLRSILSYDDDTGTLWWKYRSDRGGWWNGRYAHTQAFTAIRDGGGYNVGNINARTYRAHRVVWAMKTGEWPKEHIDHIDGNPTNNRFDNLREATNSENGMNRGKQVNNTCGHKGVTFHKKAGRWMSQIQCKGKTIYLGLFNCPTAAHFAYVRSVQKYHGDFANTGEAQK